jgi:hypothetical protein
MRALRFGLVVVVLSLVACATAKPPAVPVTDVSRLAGIYTGSVDEVGLAARPVRLVVLPDGSYEITAAEPAGYRFNGRISAMPDGTLRYSHDNDRTNGRGVVYEGDGRRVLEFTRADGRVVVTVDKSLP